MPSHRAEPEWSRGRILGALVALAVLVAVVFGGYALLTGGGADEPREAGAATPGEGASPSGDAAAATTPSADGAGETAACEEASVVEVAAAPSIAPVVEQVAEDLGDECTEYAVSSQPSVAVVAAAGEGSEPDVWLPDSTLWVELAAAQGAPLEGGPVVATSPVALVGPAAVVSGVGLESGMAWPELLAADAPLRATDPQQDVASLLTLLTAESAFGDDPAGRQQAAGVLVNVGRQFAPAPELLEAAEGGEEIVFPGSEQLVAADDDLAAVVPEGGLGTLSFPVVAMPGRDAGPAADALAEALLSEGGAAALSEAGLRPGEDGAGPGVDGIPEQSPPLSAQPDATDVAAATSRWSTLTKEQRMLAVLDVSGSMDEEVGDTTRIGIATAAAERAMSLMRPQSQVGLWEFSTARGEDGEDFAELVPIRTLSEQAGQQTQAELLLATASGLDEDATTGDTGLHDTVLAAFEHMQETHDADYVNSVVLLTDGVNDDSTGGLSEDELVAELEDRADPDRPVTVVLVGMGPSVDGGALQRIAEATGGRAYVAEDPADIIGVFLDAVSHRAGR